MKQTGKSDIVMSLKCVICLFFTNKEWLYHVNDLFIPKLYEKVGLFVNVCCLVQELGKSASTRVDIN